MKKISFCVMDAGYLDAGIVAINSYFRFNKNIPLVVFVEEGTNTSRLQEATEGQNIEIRQRQFPELPEHQALGVNNPYFDLFVNRQALPAYAMRLKALQELREEADIIVNFDLDVIFLNSIEKMANMAERSAIYGVSERENRARWMRQLGTREIVNKPDYINTGFVIYGADAVADISLEAYAEFLAKYPNDIYCPEQDFINYFCGDSVQVIRNNYNLMFTAPEYQDTAPVVLHFLGRFKPWSIGSVPDGVGHYFRRYLAEAEKNAGFISGEFINKIKKNVNYYFC